MALIKCPECSKDISEKASVCIHCGYPLSNDYDNVNVLSSNNIKDTNNKSKVTQKTNEKQIVKTKMIIYGCILLVGILLISYIAYNTIEQGKKCNKFQCEEYHVKGGKACKEHTCLEEGCFYTVVGNSRYCVKHK